MEPPAPTFVPEIGHFESLGYLRPTFPSNGTLRLPWHHWRLNFTSNGTLCLPWYHQCLNFPLNGTLRIPWRQNFRPNRTLRIRLRIQRLNFAQDGTLCVPCRLRRPNVPLKRDASRASAPSGRLNFTPRRDALRPLAPPASKFPPKRDASRSLARTFSPQTGRSVSLGAFGA